MTCPGCGASLKLGADFFVIRCSYCDSVLRVKMPDMPPAYLAHSRVDKRQARFRIDRHLKEQGLPLTGSDIQFKKVYYPYWKVDASVLKIRSHVEERVIGYEDEYGTEEVEEKVKSITTVAPYSATLAAGPDFKGIPPSIGIRGTTVTMIPYAKESLEKGFTSYPAISSRREIWERITAQAIGMGRVASTASHENLTELFNPTFSVVYFPFFIADSFSGPGYRRLVVDGLSGRVVSDFDPLADAAEGTDKAEGVAWSDSDEEVEFGELGIEMHRCASCGVDLPDSQSYVYICRNCNSLNLLENAEVPVEQIVTCAVEANRGDQQFPFWSFKLSAADSEALGSVLGGLYDSDRLVIPAFRMPLGEAMLRLARRMSSAVPRLDMRVVGGYNADFKHVDVSLHDAMRYISLFIHWVRLTKTGKSETALTEYRPESAELIYAPFHPESYFYVDSALQSITFEKSLVG